MREMSEKELCVFFSAYAVCDPGDFLVERTKRLMREEVALAVLPSPKRLDGWLGAILGIALLLVLNLFYAVSVGTLLGFVLSPAWSHILTRSMFVCAAAEICMIAGMLLIVVFTQFKPAYSRGRVAA
jgi:hypothetical protein